MLQTFSSTIHHRHSLSVLFVNCFYFCRGLPFCHIRCSIYHYCISVLLRSRFLSLFFTYHRHRCIFENASDLPLVHYAPTQPSINPSHLIHQHNGTATQRPRPPLLPPRPVHIYRIWHQSLPIGIRRTLPYRQWHPPWRHRHRHSATISNLHRRSPARRAW